MPRCKYGCLMPCLKLCFDEQKPPKFYLCNINARTYKVGIWMYWMRYRSGKKRFSEIRKYNGGTIHMPPLVKSNVIYVPQFFYIMRYVEAHNMHTPTTMYARKRKPYPCEHLRTHWVSKSSRQDWRSHHRSRCLWKRRLPLKLESC
jgi:hypothetical protein